MKAFITGGTGFIGSHLIDFLLNKGTQIFALVRDLDNLKALKGLNVHFLEGGLFSLPSLPSDLDYVFHLAGLTKASKSADYYTVNQQGSASLFQFISNQKISPKVVYLSSLAAAGPCLDEKPIKESDSPNPVTHYGKSKLKGEEEALKFKDRFPIVILRAGAVFGPRDQDFLNFFKFINRGILPTFDVSQRPLSLCYVKDLVNALYLASQKELASGEIINIANPQPYSWDEIGRAAGQALGKNLRRIVIPLPIVYLFALVSGGISTLRRKPSIINRHKFKEMRQKGWVADVVKAREKLSFQTQYSLEEAMQETIDWYQRYNWL